ncbi:unnamed protein product [Symbiodinium sp. CCMP2592]|nr:unnamed protein product [Symbiodinium sp. CCMP2592]
MGKDVVKKKPAAKTVKSLQTKASVSSATAPTTDKPFDIDTFIKHLGGLGPGEADFSWGSGFDGINAVGHVIQTLLPSAQHIFGRRLDEFRQRFAKSPLDPKAVSESTFQAAVRALKKHKPVFFLLENVVGCRKKAKGETSSPLDHYLRVLKGMDGGYDVQAINITGRPLAEKRERVFILGSRCPDLTASDWARKSQLLEEVSKEMPIHALSCKVTPVEALRDEVTSWKADAAYHNEFAALMSKLSEKFKGDPLIVKDMKDRASSKLRAVRHLTPIQKANVDVIEMMATRSAEEARKADSSFVPYILADISQKASFGGITLNKTWTTLTTSTRLLDFQQGEILPATSHLEMLGWNKSWRQSSNLQYWSQSEIYDLTGNSMSLAAVTKVLLPLMKHVTAEGRRSLQA